MSTRQQYRPFEEDFHTERLGNGLRILMQRTHSNVAYCGFAVDAGTRDETAGQEGLAHFIEHMLFKGTEKRKAWHILNRMEHVGGDLNAFTNKEETVFYTAFLKEDFERALELLSDIVFHSIFPEKEIKKEREVVIDEFKSYLDSPSELIFDDFEGLIFPDHSLGKNILGTLDSIESFSRESAMEFYHQHYHPENMVFFLQGDFEEEKTLALIKKALSGIQMPGILIKDRKPASQYQPKTQKVHKKTHQAHVMTGCRCFSGSDKRKSALFLLNNILGGPGMNSRLNVSLRERKGLVYDVEANATCYSDTGTFCIYLGCDKKDVSECLQLVQDELSQLWKESLNPKALLSAKKQFIGQIGVSSDNHENAILEMAKFYLHYDKTSTIQDAFENIRALDAASLQEVASLLFHKENLSTLIYA